MTATFSTVPRTLEVGVISDGKNYDHTCTLLTMAELQNSLLKEKNNPLYTITLPEEPNERSKVSTLETPVILAFAGVPGAGDYTKTIADLLNEWAKNPNKPALLFPVTDDTTRQALHAAIEQWKTKHPEQDHDAMARIRVASKDNLLSSPAELTDECYQLAGTKARIPTEHVRNLQLSEALPELKIT